MSFVEELYLYGNRISQLPSEIGNLKKLRKLGLNENSIDDLPSKLLLPYFTPAAPNRYIFNLAELRNCVSLKVLDLRHNKLRDFIPVVVYELVSLEILYLKFNKITEVSPAICNLRVSYPIHSDIQLVQDMLTICVLLSQQNLTSLILRENKLKYLPPAIGSLGCLTALDVSHNFLETLPDGKY